MDTYRKNLSPRIGNISIDTALVKQLVLDARPRDVNIQQGQAAYNISTSRSTGEPKGIMVEHAAVAIAQGPALAIDSTSRVFHFCPYLFDASLMKAIITFVHGRCVSC
ncbi:hypothetical protein ETB97_011431 [Aspergillus alliaceus]|uniref:Uncharacterized protein n=1 Tax=Petromyces alliaceus TaxID=209559 RepID=A0A5N6FM86_PETAA|nr:uncharacterized protein BDW43DRAFT_314737 [Aspergillus alliaceus]KAB8229703.1 hypothetical protein BDW43DRAFT_314737 [Aspergillus alliaceus]KAF5866546.1 hypothetical protein ETB97_011431 [Aspergillus burnettii]